MRLKLVTVVVFTAFCVGCLSKSPSDWGGLFEKTAGGRNELEGKPKFDVVGQNLGESQEVSLDTGVLARRVSELIRADQKGHAAAWIMRHPDAALECLRSVDAATPLDVYQFIAEVHDKHAVTRNHRGWLEVVELRKQKPELFTAYAEARKLFRSRIQDGSVDRALELELPKRAADTKAVMLQIDAAQSFGTACLLGDRPQDAVNAFASGVAWAREVCTYQAAYLMLLESDARRRTGDGIGAANVWSHAVTAAGELMANEPPVRDPVLWEKFGYLRPIERGWPVEIINILAVRDPLPGTESEPLALRVPVGGEPIADPPRAETVLWHSIGHWYLDRGHAQAALIAFKRSESTAKAAETSDWLRLRQAKSLAQLDQSGPATAILVSLLAKRDTPLKRPASALLGSIYLQRGQARKALSLLKTAAEEDDGFEWPERSDAEADLGLAYLTLGDAGKGLDRLHRAQQRFENDVDREQLAVALENEMKFFEHTGKRSEAAAVKARLRDVQSRW